MFGKAYYNGQTDPVTGKPDGLGLAISNNGEKMYEGVFRKGYIDVPHLHLNKDSAKLILKTELNE